MDTAYVVSQLFWFVIRPGNLLFIVLAIGTATVWMGRGPNGRIWLTTLSGILLLVTLLPVHGWMARPLEERFPLPGALPEAVDGIVVLGEIVQGETAKQRGVLAISESAERVMIPAGLAMQYPRARLLIAGRGEHDRSLIDWFGEIGIGRERIDFETESRNTYENALFSRRLIEPRPDETWVLVTSAQHMPRTVGVFRKIGWSVIPYPVDYRSLADEPLSDRLDVAGNLVRLGDAMKEWIGLAAYYALDRSDELFPSPDE